MIGEDFSENDCSSNSLSDLDKRFQAELAQLAAEQAKNSNESNMTEGTVSLSEEEESEEFGDLKHPKAVLPPLARAVSESSAKAVLPPLTRAASDFGAKSRSSSPKPKKKKPEEASTRPKPSSSSSKRSMASRSPSCSRKMRMDGLLDSNHGHGSSSSRLDSSKASSSGRRREKKTDKDGAKIGRPKKARSLSKGPSRGGLGGGSEHIPRGGGDMERKIPERSKSASLKRSTKTTPLARSNSGVSSNKEASTRPSVHKRSSSGRRLTRASSGDNQDFEEATKRESSRRAKKSSSKSAEGVETPRRRSSNRDTLRRSNSRKKDQEETIGEADGSTPRRRSSNREIMRSTRSKSKTRIVNGNEEDGEGGEKKKSSSRKTVRSMEPSSDRSRSRSKLVDGQERKSRRQTSKGEGKAEQESSEERHSVPKKTRSLQQPRRLSRRNLLSGNDTDGEPIARVSRRNLLAGNNTDGEAIKSPRKPGSRRNLLSGVDTDGQPIRQHQRGSRRNLLAGSGDADGGVAARRLSRRNLLASAAAESTNNESNDEAPARPAAADRGGRPALNRGLSAKRDKRGTMVAKSRQQRLSSRNLMREQYKEAVNKYKDDDENEEDASDAENHEQDKATAQSAPQSSDQEARDSPEEKEGGALRLEEDEDAPQTPAKARKSVFGMAGSGALKATKWVGKKAVNTTVNTVGTAVNAGVKTTKAAGKVTTKAAGAAAHKVAGHIGGPNKKTQQSQAYSHQVQTGDMDDLASLEFSTEDSEPLANGAQQQNFIITPAL